MIVEILSHTPRWVFALFFGLAYLGYLQTKTRVVSAKRLVILPIAMLGLSLSGVNNTFGSGTLALTFWLGAVALGVALALFLGIAKNVGYARETHTFSVPGSWLPLSLMMAIFLTRYVVGASVALNPRLVALPAFVGAACAGYGFWSGLFFGRLVNILNVHGRQAISRAFAA